MRSLLRSWSGLLLITLSLAAGIALTALLDRVQTAESRAVELQTLRSQLDPPLVPPPPPQRPDNSALVRQGGEQ